MCSSDLKENRLLPASQSAVFVHHLIAYDDHYQGTADTPDEGERLAALMGDKPIVFMKNHGVLVTGNTIAQAYRRLYRLERVCRTQVLAMSTGRELEVLSEEIIGRVLAPAEATRRLRPKWTRRRCLRAPIFQAL